MSQAEIDKGKPQGIPMTPELIAIRDRLMSYRDIAVENDTYDTSPEGAAVRRNMAEPSKGVRAEVLVHEPAVRDLQMRVPIFTDWLIAQDQRGEDHPDFEDLREGGEIVKGQEGEFYWYKTEYFEASMLLHPYPPGASSGVGNVAATKFYSTGVLQETNNLMILHVGFNEDFNLTIQYSGKDVGRDGLSYHTGWKPLLEMTGEENRIVIDLFQQFNDQVARIPYFPSSSA